MTEDGELLQIIYESSYPCSSHEGILGGGAVTSFVLKLRSK